MADEHRATKQDLEVAQTPPDSEHRTTKLDAEIAQTPSDSGHRPTKIDIEVVTDLIGGEHRTTALGAEVSQTALLAESFVRSTALSIEVVVPLDLPHLFNAIPQSAPASGHQGKPFIAILELDFPGGQERLSLTGIRTPDNGFYKAEVETFGSFARELSETPTEFRIAEAQVSVSNVENQFSKLRATEPIKGTIARIRVSNDPSLDLASFQTVYEGEIASDWSITPISATLTIVDPWTRFLG